MTQTKAKDITGERFGLLTVVARGDSKRGTAMWECRCDCGQSRVIAGTCLRAGRQKSCGCASPRFTSKSLTTHGMSRTRAYKIWVGMHGRCSSSSSGKERALYFEKGIRVCERWGSFESFIEDMGSPPSSRHSIDRIDGSRGYGPDNCRWADAKTQGNNTSANRFIEHGGRRLTVSQWAGLIGIKRNTLLYRIRRGWPIERALAVTVRRLMGA